MSEANVMIRLKTETADLHASAEGRDFQRRMVQGEITRAEYAAWLGQMLLVHVALEDRLREQARDDARFAAVRDEQMQVPYIMADLATLGEEPSSEPLPATAALVAEIEDAASDDALRLLGFHYVLEGSNNGNRYIAGKLLPALGLEAAGGRYLDPYGEAQREKWAQFKLDMDAVGFSSEEADTLVAAARRMFQAVSEISDELNAARAGA